MITSWSEVNDFGHYGIFDEEECFYPEVLEKLKSDLESGNDFDTGWHGFKKEIQSMRICACGNEIVVIVWCGMDEMPDLIFDCEGAENLSEKQIEYVEDMWCNELFVNTETELDCVVPRNSTVEFILSKATKLAAECDAFFGRKFLHDESFC